jgi:serine/threonine-protein kinase
MIDVVPETEAGTELLRLRLVVWSGVTAILATSYTLSANLAGFFLLGRSWKAQLLHPGNWAVSFEIAFIAGLWLACRKLRLSLRALQAIDASMMGLLSLVGAYLSYLCPAAVHPGLDLGAPPSANLPIGVVSNIAMLSLRAALLPSTPRRTLSVSLAATLPVLVAGFAVYAKYGSADALNFALGTSLVSLVVIPIPVLISRVIYHLSRRVEDAVELGNYTLEGKIGEGGMGVVHRARHALLRRPTAIKLLRADRAGSSGLARFEREVLQTSRLTHPNTVSIYDYGHTAEGDFYYAMEYLEGLSFEELGRIDGPQPPGRVVHLVRQACGALSEAHRRALIHRDVKPANLFLCVRGDIPDYVKVLDFGLAKELSAPPSDLSSAGAFLGTPLYMAPEAIAHPSSIDQRADLYALGAVAYFLLAGAPPFEGDRLVEVCAKILHADPVKPSLRAGRPVPESLEDLVLRCLSKRPEQRPANARELADALAECRDVPPWSSADAEHWWQHRASEVVASARRQRGGEGWVSAGGPLAVDFERRPRK